MNVRRLITTAGGIAIVAGLSLTAWLAWSKHSTEMTREMLLARRSKLSGEIRRWEAEETASKKLFADGETSPNTRDLPVAPPPEATPSPPAPEMTSADWRKDPRVQVLALARDRAELASSYGPFFRARNLSAAQVEQLCDALIKYQAFREDIDTVGVEKNLTPQAIKALRDEATGEFRNDVTAALGPGGYEEWQSYRRALPVRTLVGKIAGEATLAGTPLTLPQIETLTTLIAQTDAQFAAGGPVRIDHVDWKSAEAQAQAVLSPAQLKLFQTSSGGAQRNQLHTEFSKARHRAMAEMGPELKRMP